MKHKPEARPEAKPEPETRPTPTAKPEAKPETKPEPQPVTRPVRIDIPDAAATAGKAASEATRVALKVPAPAQEPKAPPATPPAAPAAATPAPPASTAAPAAAARPAEQRAAKPRAPQAPPPPHTPAPPRPAGRTAQPPSSAPPSSAEPHPAARDSADEVEQISVEAAEAQIPEQAPRLRRIGAFTRREPAAAQEPDAQEPTYVAASELSSRERERLILDQALRGLSPAQQRRYRKDMRRLRRTLRKHTSGKPTRPASMQTVPEVIGRGFSRLIKVVVIILILAIVLVSGVGGGMLLGYISTTEPLNPAMLTSGSQTSRVYDKNGELISISTGAQNIDREIVEFSTIKDGYLDEAFKAIEDERFDTNIGIDPRRIASAVVSAIMHGGTPQHGGSTITQQTVKLLTGEDEISAQRKVQEWYKAILLKRDLTNDEIMEIYLNSVPMANSYVGVQSAARAYFEKDAADLTLGEAAFLAGIPKAPSVYNPRTELGMRNALRRQRIVLAKMLDLNFITQAQYDEALNSELVVQREPPPLSGTSINSYFVEYVYKQTVADLIERRGYTREAARNLIYSGGVRIYTTFDPKVQALVDATFNKEELFAAAPERYAGLPDLPQAGMAIIDNQTGAVVAMGGGRGTKDANLVLNRATDIARQPGSAIKPLNVYAPALEMGLVSGATMVLDEMVFMDPQRPDVPYPKNAYYPEYRGWMTIRNAVKISNNVPAAKVIEMVGLDNSRYYLNKVGIDRLEDGAQLAMAVGGFEKGMNPLEMASAFATFPNGGLYIPYYSYTKVLDSNNTVILENRPSYELVYSPETAYMMSRILEEVMLPGYGEAFWYGGSAEGHGMMQNIAGEIIQTAGKTGTTDNDYDKWFCCFTPYYTAAVWYGFDVLRTIQGPDNEGAKRILFDVFDPLHADLAAVDWTVPSNIVERQIDMRTGHLASPELQAAWPQRVYTEYFVRGSPLIPTLYETAPTVEPPATESADVQP
ncbi:MAG: transglycosylase domain-containing protein [Bacillota bacterium]|nr:transglycosylase domain-containing protein [Bacillota bacterium]